MPRYVRLHPEAANAAKIATEAELLAFANKLRAAGDADPIEALLPSKPGNSKTCLIANACNFRSEVIPVGSTDPIDETNTCWVLKFPSNMPLAKRKAIAAAVGCEIRTIRENDGEMHHNVLVLPDEIGHAADAFDIGKAFKRFDQYKKEA